MAFEMIYEYIQYGFDIIPPNLMISIAVIPCILNLPTHSQIKIMYKIDSIQAKAATQTYCKR